MTKSIFTTFVALCVSSAMYVFAQSPVDRTPPEKGVVIEHVVQIATDYGTMKIKLFNETPKHRDNFLKLVKEGYYNDLLFHRVINNFMIQGGDPDSKNAKADKKLGEGGPNYTIPAEFVPALYHKKGALAAAREGDDVNPNKESSGSQFYIVQGTKVDPNNFEMMERRYKTKFSDEQKLVYSTIGGAPSLDNNYTVFGEVIEGLDVIDKITAVEMGKNDRPAKDIKMKITLIK